jgi:virginiamycin B lyase
MTTSGIYAEVAVPTPNTSPNAIAVGADRNLWVTALEGQRVGRVSLNAVVNVDEFALAGADAALIWTRSITGGPDGKLWITQEGRLKSVTIDGGTVVEHACPLDCSPRGITTGSDNNLWYVDPTRSAIVRFTP